MVRHLRIANARQHVCDWIGCGHRLTPVILSLPARLDHAGHFAGESKLPEANPAELKFTQETSWTPTPEAPIAVSAGELWFRGVFCNFCGCCHLP
jgi:hypothetical protein